MDLDDIMDGAGWGREDLCDVLVDFLHHNSLYDQAVLHAKAVAYQERLWTDK
jgi:hypothetical protein